MKVLMLGNEAVARGLYEAGVSIISSYPGTPSTEITEETARYKEIYCEWAPNEKVALEVAFGASLAGKRASCAMKHVGLNVAADPLFTISYTGVNAGLVICVADDPGMHSSQNEQDSRHYAVAAKIPMLEPSDSEEAKKFTKMAFEISEKYDTPVLLKLCTRIAHSRSVVSIEEPAQQVVYPYQKDSEKYVMLPKYARTRHLLVEQRICVLQEYAEISELNRIEMGGRKLGIITSSTCYQYVKEVFGQEVSILKIGMIHPLPIKKIVEFATRVERLVVIEELDNLIEAHCRELGLSVEGKEIFGITGEFSQNIIAQKLGKWIHSGLKIEDEPLPVRVDTMCAGCPHRAIFYILAKNNCTVIGDIGCYSLGSTPPLNAMDVNICMGASVSMIHGFNKALSTKKELKTVAVIGDSTFIHSGMTGLVNISYNQSNSTVVILDNSITGMTGHQPNPTSGFNLKGEPAAKINLEQLCKALGIESVRVVDPYDLELCEKAIKQEIEADQSSVIISRRPCVLMKNVMKGPRVTNNNEICTGCKVCMKLGCPAIKWVNNKASIDNVQCRGCGMCVQICKSHALKMGGE